VRERIWIYTCDSCGTKLDAEPAATMRVTPLDKRQRAKVADLCADCFDQMPGRAVQQAGRKKPMALAHSA
jgi:hypothetical protein